MSVRDPRQEIQFGTPPGWRRIVDELVKDLNKSDADIEIVQVKEKFGGLRFYIDLRNQLSEEAWRRIYERIDQAESESYSVCDRDGSPGKFRKDLSWVRTLCDECYEERNNER